MKNHDDDAQYGPKATGTSRRSFLKGMSVVAGAGVMLPVLGRAQSPGTSTAPDTEGESHPDIDFLGSESRRITLQINGKPATVEVEPRTTLLDALRAKLNMTGSKEVCDRGACGCCSVLIDGRAVASCMTLAVDAQGKEITTVEGIADDPKYKNLIDGMCEHDAAQCGFCIPGFTVSAAEFLSNNKNPSRAEIAEGLSGNLCRCGTYSKLFDGIEAAVKKGGVS